MTLKASPTAVDDRRSPKRVSFHRRSRAASGRRKRRTRLPTTSSFVGAWQSFSAPAVVDDASLLAHHDDVDLHEAVDLVRRGCPPATALRILS